MSEFYTGNFYLTQGQMEVNALYIYEFLRVRSWTVNAIAGMLGNMEAESTLNPGIWQSLNEGNTSGGYGLVQWTPATKYLDWCNENGYEPSHLDSALQRIVWERANGVQYYPTTNYPITWQEFKHSTLSPAYLAKTFLYNYERPKDPKPEARGALAEKWYTFLTGDIPNPDTPTPTPTPTIKKHKMSLLMMFKAVNKNNVVR